MMNTAKCFEEPSGAFSPSEVSSCARFAGNRDACGASTKEKGSLDREMAEIVPDEVWELLYQSASSTLNLLGLG